MWASKYTIKTVAAKYKLGPGPSNANWGRGLVPGITTKARSPEIFKMKYVMIP